jgi:peroxiredoxin
MTKVDAHNLLSVDWSTLPVPVDDGAAAHLVGMQVPDIELEATDGARIRLATMAGKTVLFAYPRTGVPGESVLQGDWDMIPGARGCTPQACAFRDVHNELLAAGARQVFGLSTQSSSYQREAAERLHLPFALLSDAQLELTRALRLPKLQLGDDVMTKRLTMLFDNGRIARVWYPVFPPDRNASDVRDYLRSYD